MKRGVKKLKKIEPYVLVLGIFACALSIDPNSADIMPLRYVIWAVLAIILFLSISYRAIKYSDVDFSVLKRTVFPVFCGYLVASIFSLIFALNVSEGIYQILKGFLLIIFVFEVIVIEKKPLIKSFVLLAILLGAIGVWKYITVEAITLRAGTMGGKNLLSSALLLLLPFCVYSLYAYRWKFVSVISIAIILFNIVTLQSRAVWLGLAVAAMAVLAAKKKLLIGVIAVLVVFGISCLLLPEEIIEIGVNQKSLANRMQIWSASWDMLKDNPLGVGIGNWYIAIQKYGQSIIPPEGGGVAYKEVFYTRMHNDFFQVLTEVGGVGLICYLGIFVCSFYYAAKTRNLMALGGLMVYVGVAFFSFLSERAFHPMILAVFIAISLSEYHKKRKLVFAPQRMYLVSVIVLSILALALVDFWHRYDTACMVKRIAEQRRTGNFRGNLYELNGYPSWFASLDRLGTPILHYKGEVAYVKHDYATALEFYKMSEKYSPYNIYVLNNIGGGYCILGDQDKAIDYLSRALEIMPNCKPALRNMKVAQERKIKENDVHHKGTNFN